MRKLLSIIFVNVKFMIEYRMNKKTKLKKKK